MAGQPCPARCARGRAAEDYDALSALVAKWKAKGIERIAEFNCPAGPGEFGHTQLWRLKSADQYEEMSREFGQTTEVRRFVERWNFYLGWGPREGNS